MNFFQHHSQITTKVPGTGCTDHGVKRMTVQWARGGSGFIFFRTAALMLVRKMPVPAVVRIMEVIDKPFWRIIEHYVGKALAGLDLNPRRPLPSTRGHPGEATTMSPC